MIYTCLRKCNFLIAFLFFFLLFINVLLFSVYCCILCKLYVIALACSLFKKKKKLVYSQVSGDSARFLVFTVGTLVENLLVYGVLYRSKMVQSRIFFVLMC